MNHGLMPTDRVKFRFSTGIVVQRGATNEGYFVVVQFEKPVKFKRHFWNDEIKSLKKLKK